MPDKQYGARLHPALIGVALVLVAVAGAIIAFQHRGGDDGSADANRRLALGFLTTRIPVEASDALAGDTAAYDALERSAAELVGEIDAGVPADTDRDAWRAFADDARAVVGARENVLGAYRAAEDVASVVPELLASVASAAGGLGAARLEELKPQLDRVEVLGQRIAQDMRALAAAPGDVEALVGRLADGVDQLGQAVGALADPAPGAGEPPVNAPDLAAATAAQARLADIVRATISSADQLIAARAARVRLSGEAAQLHGSLAASAAPPGGSPGFLDSPWLPIGLLGGVLLALAGLALLHGSTSNVRREAQKHARQNERNQDAILRLLDELSNLADGDLTVQATVTEDITGAIADSINYAIEALRELVTTINDTAITLDASTRQTQATAGHLAKASVAQSKQIGSASESIAAMAGSVEEVSGNAERAADVARHSVDIAHKGGDAVRRTIDGMNAIRETIQETSKRIKRLGESSQEIGNIVEMINDIAEQTNILALNASIQASMAGEAGRGFAVVADEVQRLAERAAVATKQIEVLVRTIQADTNEAVVSMERSTTDVVGGALLAENAGAALEEIEKVSNQIASLVQNISGSARQQAGAAGNISRNMHVLREISSQTADNTSATSTSIGKLAELATQLRKSVSGFRLPGVGGGTAILGPAVAKDAEPVEPREQRKLGGVA
jgi:twitching motility protein PilJ